MASACPLPHIGFSGVPHHHNGHFWACTHLHTVVTDAAVGAARRPVETAGGAPLHAHLDALDLHCFVQGSSEVILFVLILLR